MDFVPEFREPEVRRAPLQMEREQMVGEAPPVLQKEPAAVQRQPVQMA